MAVSLSLGTVFPNHRFLAKLILPDMHFLLPLDHFIWPPMTNKNFLNYLFIYSTGGNTLWEGVSYHDNIHTITTIMFVPWHDGHYCNSQASQLGKSGNESPLTYTYPVFYTASYDTMKASQQEGSFLIVLTYLYNILWPMCIISSSIGSYHWLLLGNQDEWHTICLACQMWEHGVANQYLCKLRPTTWEETYVLHCPNGHEWEVW